MPDETEDFIARMSGAFGEDREARILAERELRPRLDGAEPAAVEAAAKRLALSRFRLAPWRRRGAWIAGSIVYVLLLMQTDLRSRIGALDSHIPLPGPAKTAFLDRIKPKQDSVLKGMFPPLTAEQEGLIDRDPTKLRSLLPQDPAVLAEAAAAWEDKYHETPPNFLEEQQQLDPENGWFPFFAAMSAATKAMKSTPPDPWRLEEAIEWFHRAAALPRFDSYRSEMLQRRLRLMPQPHSIAEQEAVSMYLADATFSNASLPDKLGRCVAAKAQSLEKASDADGAKRLIDDWEKLVDLYLPNPENGLLDGYGKAFFLSGSLPALVHMAASFGFEADSRRLSDLSTRWEDLKKSRSPSPPLPSILGEKAGSLPSMLFVGGVPMRPEDIPALEDMTPGRLAEHELAWNAMSALASAVLAFITAGFSCYRLRTGRLHDKLAREMGELLTAGDCAWVLGAGIALPFAAMQWLVRATPLAGWNWGLSELDGVQPAMAMGLQFWMLLVMPVIVAKWRIGRRAGFAGLRWPRPWIMWAVFAVLLLPPVFCLRDAVRAPGFPGLANRAEWAFFSVALLSLIIAGLPAILGRSEKLLKRALLVQTVRSAWAAGALALAAGAVFSRTRETYWVERDSFMRPDVSQPAATRMEYHATEYFRSQLLELWNSSAGK